MKYSKMIDEALKPNMRQMLNHRDFVALSKSGLGPAISACLARGESISLTITRTAPRLDKWDRQMLLDQLRLGRKFRRRLER